ncbi:hypothetical protein Tco_0139590 [Tanacetum coccineum]
MPYPRFTKVIINYFLLKHKSIPKGHDSCINCIKNDGVLGKLKFVSKGKDNQVYGITIPDVMVNDDIKKSKACQTYLAISTGIVVLKKAREGMKSTATPTKKGLITAEENILSDPDEAVQLGESMSLTEAEIAKEERRVHETHASLVIGREKASEIPKGSSEGSGSKPEVPDEPKDKSKGLSKGVGITPEVLDEPKGKYAVHDRSNDDWGSDEEVILSSDDERTESEREVAKSDKADDETFDEKEVHDDEKMHDADEIHANDEETDEEIADVEKVDTKKTEEEKVDNEHARANQAAKDDQARALISMTQQEKLEFPPSRSSLSLSSDYGNQFLNVSSNVSLVEIIKETADTEINSMLHVPIQQEIPPVQQTSLLDVLLLVISTVKTTTPSTTPPTTEIQATLVTTTDPSPTVLLRFSELERKVEALSKYDHSKVIEESVQANVRNEFRNQIPKFLPKAVFDFFNPRIESIICEVLQKTTAFLAQSSSTHGQSSSRASESLFEYGLKKIIFDKMDRSRSYITHDKHQELYDALLYSMCLDDAIASGEINPYKLLRKRHRDKDQDPPTGSDKENNRSRKGKDSEPPKKSSKYKESSKGKTPPKTSKTSKSVTTKESFVEPVNKVAMDVEEPIINDVTWFDDLEKTAKDPTKFDDLKDSTIDFSDFIKHHLKKDKITQADLEGPVPEGDRCLFDLSKPLPSQGHPGHLTIPVDFFFNNDLEYLKTGNMERKCTASITKTKAARYDLEFIEDTIPRLWIPVKVAYDKDKDPLIVVRTADQKEYTFKKGDFPSLHLNDIKDMLLLYVQNKLFHLPSDDIVNLVIVLHMFSQNIVIPKWVKDVQLGVEIYQNKLNITKPQKDFSGISFKESYTMSYDPKGVVYLYHIKRKRLMQADELYKFSDITLKSVRKILHERLMNVKLGYNKDMPNRKWTDKD